MTSTDHGPSAPARETVADADEPRRLLGLSPTQIAGGALAAVTSALAASFFGVGGTLIGAALGSIVSTVGGALYSHSFDQAQRTLQTTRVRLVRSGAGARSVSGAPAGSRRALREAAARSEDPTALPPDLNDRAEVVADAPAAYRRTLNWRTLTAVAGAFFVIAVAAITLTEVLIGHPVSNASETGTSVTHVLGGDSGTAKLSPTPSPSSSSSTSPSASTGPSPEPSATPSDAGSSSPTTDPGQAPLQAPTPDAPSSAPAASDQAPAPAASGPAPSAVGNAAAASPSPVVAAG